MSAANVAPGVNRVISDVLVTARAQDAAAGLPAGSAVGVVFELREAALKLLGLLLQRADCGDEDADTLDRCEAEGNLSVGLLRQVLESVDYVLRDRDRLQRASVDDGGVGGVGADERFKVGEPGNKNLVGGPLASAQPGGCLDGDPQMRRYHQVLFRDVATHNKSPYVARALTRYVTGAILAAAGWLQRKAVTRRVAVKSRPSGTIPGGER